MTNIGGLHECQSFVVHADFRMSSIVTTQDCKNVSEAYVIIFVYVSAVTPVTCVDDILMNFGVQINLACIE